MINRNLVVIAMILIFLSIPYIQVESNDSIEIRGGYGDEVIEPGKILFAHYIGSKQKMYSFWDTRNRFQLN